MVREGRRNPDVVRAVLGALIGDETSLLRAFELASRFSERLSYSMLAGVVGRFPSSRKIAVGLVGLALRSMRYKHVNERGHVHLALHDLRFHFEDVVGALDLLDAVEPAYTFLATHIPSCAPCVKSGVENAVDAIEELYERVPDPDAVVVALMSRRRSALAHRAALRIAARHVLPGGRRALQRFASLRRELYASGDGLAAFLRQSEVDRVTPALAKHAPMPTALPFESLRELVALPGLELVLGAWATPAAGDPKDAWEDAWRRRHAGGEPQLGTDAVALERTRRLLLADGTSDEERNRARGVLLVSNSDADTWLRLVDACARRGDAYMAERILETKLSAGGSVPARVLVDLWSLGDASLRTAVVAKLVRQKDLGWHDKVWAAEREAAARGTHVDGLRERVARALVEAGSPSHAITKLVTLEQLRAVVEHLLVHAEPVHVAAAYAYLEDPLSLRAFRDALFAQPEERREAILAEIKKLERSSPRSKTFFAWLIGGIETA